MLPPSNDITALQLSLFRGYVLLVERVERMPPLSLRPLAARFRFIKLPMAKIVVQVFVTSHIRRIVEALDRAYQLRSAIEQPHAKEDDWRKLHEQAGSLLSGLPSVVLSKWILALLVFLAVFLTGKIVPQNHFAVTAKLIVAFLTIDPEKLSELAAEPDAGPALLGLAAGVFVLFFVVTPMIVYHFRLKRMLFNGHAPLSPSAPVDSATIGDIWKQKETSANSQYALEAALFTSLGAPIRREIPMDLFPPLVIFGLYAIGPGLVVGIVAANVWAANRSAAETLYVVAAINLLIGVTNVTLCVKTIRQRSIIHG
jgi:hypothetical protein